MENAFIDFNIPQTFPTILATTSPPHVTGDIQTIPHPIPPATLGKGSLFCKDSIPYVQHEDSIAVYVSILSWLPPTTITCHGITNASHVYSATFEQL